MWRLMTLAAALFAAVNGCAHAPRDLHAKNAAPSVLDAVGDCALSAEDAAWIDQAMANWTFVRHEILNVAELSNVEAVFFSGECQLNNASIMTSGAKTPWQIASHGGVVKLPDGSEMPPVVTSFSSGEDGVGYFAMSTPSVWRAGGVKSQMGLDVLMYAVMLHEGSHVLQLSTYGAMIEEQTEKFALPEDFNDDSLQELFGENPDYSAAVKAEIAIFLKSAQAATKNEAETIARKALRMMDDRRDRWLVGDHDKYRNANDVWLTLEGSGQWVGYAWLVHPDGHALDPQTAIDEWGLRSRFWTQNEGFAMALALDRLSNDWKVSAFQKGGDTLTGMLREAVTDAPD